MDRINPGEGGGEEEKNAPAPFFSFDKRKKYPPLFEKKKRKNIYKYILYIRVVLDGDYRHDVAPIALAVLAEFQIGGADEILVAGCAGPFPFPLSSRPVGVHCR